MNGLLWVAVLFRRPAEPEMFRMLVLYSGGAEVLTVSRGLSINGTGLVIGRC